MGDVIEKITLVNQNDLVKQSIGYIRETEVRQMTVEAMVDTGARNLVMGEETCKQLGLCIVEEREATLAGGVRYPCKVTEAVTIRWKDRYTICSALVLPGKDEILLGVMPLEDMDLNVNPGKGCLEGAHGDYWVRYVR